LILSLAKECKIGSKEPENRQNLRVATTSKMSISIPVRHQTVNFSHRRKETSFILFREKTQCFSIGLNRACFNLVINLKFFLGLVTKPKKLK